MILFSDAVPRLNNNSEEAELVLENPQAWSPLLVKYFHNRKPELIYNVSIKLVCESELGYVPFKEECIIGSSLILATADDSKRVIMKTGSLWVCLTTNHRLSGAFRRGNTGGTRS